MFLFDDELIQAARCLFLVIKKALACVCFNASILFYCSSALIPNSMDLDLDLAEVDFLTH